MKGTHNHTALLILAIATTLVVGGAYGYMRYALTGSIERAVTARDIVNSEETNKSRENDIVNLYETTADKRKRLPSFFIPSGSVVTFIEALENLGKDAGSAVTISTINDSAEAHVEARGSWSAVMRTLQAAESLPYVVHIDHVRLNVSVLQGDKSTKREWHLSFDINVAIL